MRTEIALLLAALMFIIGHWVGVSADSYILDYQELIASGLALIAAIGGAYAFWASTERQINAPREEKIRELCFQAGLFMFDIVGEIEKVMRGDEADMQDWERYRQEIRNRMKALAPLVGLDFIRPTSAALIEVNEYIRPIIEGLSPASAAADDDDALSAHLATCILMRDWFMKITDSGITNTFAEYKEAQENNVKKL